MSDRSSNPGGNGAPLVSVIITTFNRADVLREAIDSALGQRYPAIEVIVVDDGSRDETPAILKSYGDRIIPYRKPNGGYASARNAGSRLARGEYIAWLDSDDLFFPEKTAIQVAYLESHPDVVLVSADFAAFDANGSRPDTIRTYYHAFSRIPGGMETIYPEVESIDTASNPWIADRGAGTVLVRSGRVRGFLLDGGFVHPPTVMMRRDAAVKAGELDEALSNSVEYSYYFRLSRLGRFAVVDRPLLWYRYSAGQLSSAVFSVSMQTSILKVIEDLPRSDPDVVDGAAARYKERLAFCYLNAAGALAEKDRLRALSYVAKCLWLGRWERRTLRIVARALTPTAAIDLYRRWMRETDAP